MSGIDMAPKIAEVINSWQICFPSDANPGGTMFGGKLMAIMDITGGIAASRFSGRPVVTASTEAMGFKNPVKVGDRIETRAKVVWVGTTSIVVKVDVFAEKPLTGEHNHCTTAHFNFVALDENGQPTPVPRLKLQTDEDRQLFEIAGIVKKKALERKANIREKRETEKEN